MNRCVCCGSGRWHDAPVLWKALVDEWRLTPEQERYVNRQQGLHCLDCGCNLRTMALAQAVARCYGFAGLFREFVRTEAAKRLHVLEVNEAGALTQFLRLLPDHRLITYPDADMGRMTFADGTFDLVVHSDTLEHVPVPVRGLAECRRVLRPGGFCAFTVPILVERLTTSRDGMPPSYHGTAANPGDYLVQTEYGADAWRHVVQAGFAECRISCLEHPAAHALVGVR